jgi:hypothetical protein
MIVVDVFVPCDKYRWKSSIVRTGIMHSKDIPTTWSFHLPSSQFPFWTANTATKLTTVL